GALDALFAAPGLALLYLHDPMCPVNIRAMSELDGLPGPIHSIDVSTQQPLSREIVRRTGIRHESPQAILLLDGQPVWNASHHRIARFAVDEAIAAASSPQPDS
ncbi:MAG: monothiol bacilliredoxin BrxC family protein, partial [Chloroflexota bacterium]